MELLQKIQQDLISAMKEGSAIEADILKIVISALKNRRIAKGEDLTEEEQMKIVFTEANKIKDSMSKYEQAGREELAARERKQLEFVMEYLPSQADEAEVSKVVEETITEIGAEGMKDMGRVMGATMAKLQGRADGNLVNRLVREKLS